MCACTTSYYTHLDRDITISLQLPKTVIDYWSSVNKQQGLTIQLKDCVLDMKQHLQLVPHDDGLIRRPQPQWSIKHCSSTVQELAVFACSNKQQDNSSDDAKVYNTIEVYVNVVIILFIYFSILLKRGHS